MTVFSRPLTASALVLVAASLLLAPAQAHHASEILNLPVTPLNGLISGLAHPVIGPDHLVFLLALSLVGWRGRLGSMLSLLVVGLLGTAAGLLWPGLPGAEFLVALTLAVEATVVLGRLPIALLFPAMALHGYVLSGSVLGWSSMPTGTYLLGLLLSQGALLLVALGALHQLRERLQPHSLRRLAVLLMGFSGVTALAALAG